MVTGVAASLVYVNDPLPLSTMVVIVSQACTLAHGTSEALITQGDTSVPNPVTVTLFPATTAQPHPETGEHLEHAMRQLYPIYSWRRIDWNAYRHSGCA